MFICLPLRWGVGGGAPEAALQRHPDVVQGEDHRHQGGQGGQEGRRWGASFFVMKHAYN